MGLESFLAPFCVAWEMLIPRISSIFDVLGGAFSFDWKWFFILVFFLALSLVGVLSKSLVHQVLLQGHIGKSCRYVLVTGGLVWVVDAIQLGV